MSLYSHGGFICTSGLEGCRRKLSELCSQFNITVAYDSLDEGDVEEIDSAMKSHGKVGLYYAIYSNPDDFDATVLWDEARSLGMSIFKEEGLDPLCFTFTLSDVLKIPFPARYFRDMLQSRLGGFIDGLTSLAEEIPSVALIDGGIERIKSASPQECASEILSSLILPWDCSPNTLYIFAEKQR